MLDKLPMYMVYTPSKANPRSIRVIVPDGFGSKLTATVLINQDDPAESVDEAVAIRNTFMVAAGNSKLVSDVKDVACPLRGGNGARYKVLKSRSICGDLSDVVVRKTTYKSGVPVYSEYKAIRAKYDNRNRKTSKADFIYTDLKSRCEALASATKAVELRVKHDLHRI